MRCTHCSNYKAQGASGNYKAWGASGDYKAQGASGNYQTRGASGRKYEARMVIFRILAAVIDFLGFLGKRKEENWKAIEENRKVVEEIGKPLKIAES